LAALLDYARPGDTVVVTAIDRLGRSVAEVTRTIAELGERGVVDLVGVAGYYCLVSMTLNVFDVGLPPGESELLP